MNICVFCSSSDAVRHVFFETAEEIAEKIVSTENTLLYGGAKVGLMGTLAKTVKKIGGKAIGVIPEAIKNRNLDCKILDELIVTPDMHTRKAKMEELADVFIVLPGGFGTLEELVEVITLKQLHYHDKAIVIINTDNFYDSMLEHFELMYKEDFAKSDYRKMYFITNSVDDAFEHILNYTPPELESKWYKTNLKL